MIIFRKHIQCYDIGPSVIINISHIVAHRKLAGVTNALLKLIAKCSIAVIDIEVIGNRVVI